MLQHSDLLKLAAWKPIAANFGRDDSNTYDLKIKPIFREIETLGRGQVHVTATGGLSNYASALVYNRINDSGNYKSGNIQGLCIYLSLLAPIAAIGRGIAYVSDSLQWYGTIEPSAVLELEDLDSDLEKSVWVAIEKGGFKVLSRSEATTPLPPDVIPFEYCLNNEPWDRVFHVLFSDTD